MLDKFLALPLLATMMHAGCYNLSAINPEKHASSGYKSQRRDGQKGERRGKHGKKDKTEGERGEEHDEQKNPRGGGGEDKGGIASST
jgi:hypothetical protein